MVWGSATALPKQIIRQAPSLYKFTRNLSQKSLQLLYPTPHTPTASLEGDVLLDLDWRPQLTRAQRVATWTGPTLAISLLYGVLPGDQLTLVQWVCLILVFAALHGLLHHSFMESLYKAKEVMESALGDSDSTFTELENLLVHVKSKEGSQGLQMPWTWAIHCYHGFGANTWSWSRVQQRLADHLGALVTSHDMPGFGLTQRPTDLSGYLLSFNGRLGRLVLDQQLASRGLISHEEADKAGDASYPHAHVHSSSVRNTFSSCRPAGDAAAAADDLDGFEGFDEALEGLHGLQNPGGRPYSPAPLLQAGTSAPHGRAKRVLVGHSLGAACAALEVIADPSQYAAIILVDPAILAVTEGDTQGPTFHLEQLHDDSEFTRSLTSLELSEGTEAATAAAAALGGEPLPRGMLSRRRGGFGSGSSSSLSSDGSVLDLAALAEFAELLPQRSLMSTVGSSSSFYSLSSGCSSQSSCSTRSSSSWGSSSSRGSAVVLAAGEPVAYYTAKPLVGRGGRGPGSGQQGQGPSGTAAAAAIATAAAGKGLSVQRHLEQLQGGMLLALVGSISLLRPLVRVVLRALVRSRGAWQYTLQQAYHNPEKVDDETLNAYRLPQLIQGWEEGMVQFLIARLGAAGATAAAAADCGGSWGPVEDSRLAERLAAVVNAHKLPVLIVHGQGDKLVPVQNCFKLARMLQGSKLAVLKRAGHCPQEETPEAFTKIVGDFMDNLASSSR